jgi:hypothetical protein
LEGLENDIRPCGSHPRLTEVEISRNCTYCRQGRDSQTWIGRTSDNLHKLSTLDFVLETICHVLRNDGMAYGGKASAVQVMSEHMTAPQIFHAGTVL